MNKVAMTVTETQYFKSKEHMLIFALLFTDKELREQLLGISQEFYFDKDKAKEWRNVILKSIHPDSCKIDGAESAVKKLNAIYNRMVENFEASRKE